MRRNGFGAPELEAADRRQVGVEREAREGGGRVARREEVDESVDDALGLEPSEAVGLLH